MTVSKKGVTPTAVVAPLRNNEQKTAKPQPVAVLAAPKPAAPVKQQTAAPVKPVTAVKAAPVTTKQQSVPVSKKPQASASLSMFPQATREATNAMIQNFEELNTMMKTQMNTAIQSMNVFAKSMEEISKAVFQFYQNSFENNVAACKSLMACKNAQEALEIQSNLAKSNLETLVAEGGKISKMSIDAANKAFQPLQSSFTQAVDNVIKKAA